MSQQYRPLFKLDAGGMAEVYVAESEGLAGFKKRVAIKRILPNLLKDEKFVRMFLDEARLSLNLNHANTVSVFDIGKTDNAYFIVMEYVEGTTLKSVIEHATRTQRRIPVPLTCWILNEILKGLSYAHELRDEATKRPLGIVHRDVSPPNILISWNGEVKLTDFGLAKATTQVEVTDAGVVKGKFAYLAPEAATGQHVDLRADIFAVGILAWEMLTGRRLFLGGTDYETVENVRAANVPPIRKDNPDVPKDLEVSIRKSLAADPNQRYSNCNDFADDLLGVLFSHGLRVSSRDLASLLEGVRNQKAKAKPKKQARSANLIMDLVGEEMMQFQSLDQSESKSPGLTGAMPLDSLGVGDGPVFATMAPSGGTVPPGSIVTSVPEPSIVGGIPRSRLPSPAPKRAYGPLGWLVGGLLAAAAAAGAYHFFLT